MEEPKYDDVILDIIWALQDIAIIRALEYFADDPEALDLINEEFHLILDHLLVHDFPHAGNRY